RPVRGGGRARPARRRDPFLMKILHTSDWHIGKVLKGQPRLDEQLAVLKEIVEVAEAERPDLAIVAGDLYDTAAPSAETEKIVGRALRALRRHSGAVVVIAGNHDHGPRMDALRTGGADAPLAGPRGEAGGSPTRGGRR